MDDLTLGGPAPIVAQAVEDVKRMSEPLGLTLNCSKCETIEEHQTADQDVFHRFIRRGTSEASLLGAPILIFKAMDDIRLDRCNELARGMS